MPANSRAEGKIGRLNRDAVDHAWQQLVRNRSGVADLVGAKLIPIDEIDQNPQQPRTGGLEGIAELAESIAEYGLLQPIVVEAPIAPVGGRYILIAGARRLAAFQHLRDTSSDGVRWDTIPAIERDPHADDRLVLAVLENVSRHDLNEAEVMTALRALRDLKQWSSAEIARRLGMTRQWVNMFFRIADDPELSAHVQAGRLSVAKAQDVRTARSDAARAAALSAALEGAPLRHIRSLARGESALDTADEDLESHFPQRADSAPPSDAAHLSKGAARGPRGSTLPDLADLADQRGVRAPLADFQVVSLIQELATANASDVEVGEFIRRAREDLRAIRARVLAAPALRARP